MLNGFMIFFTATDAPVSWSFAELTRRPDVAACQHTPCHDRKGRPIRTTQGRMRLIATSGQGSVVRMREWSEGGGGPTHADGLEVDIARCDLAKRGRSVRKTISKRTK